MSGHAGHTHGPGSGRKMWISLIHFTGWVYADAVVSALIAAFILLSAWGIVADAVNILMKNTPKGVDVNQLVAGMKSVPLVCGVHDLHIWTVGDGLNFLSCHVALPAGSTLEECASVVGALSKKLHDDHAIGHATIQTEVEGVRAADTGLYCAIKCHAHGSHDHADGPVK